MYGETPEEPGDKEPASGVVQKTTDKDGNQQLNVAGIQITIVDNAGDVVPGIKEPKKILPPPTAEDASNN